MSAEFLHAIGALIGRAPGLSAGSSRCSRRSSRARRLPRRGALRARRGCCSPGATCRRPPPRTGEVLQSAPEALPRCARRWSVRPRRRPAPRRPVTSWRRSTSTSATTRRPAGAAPSRADQRRAARSRHPRYQGSSPRRPPTCRRARAHAGLSWRGQFDKALELAATPCACATTRRPPGVGWPWPTAGREGRQRRRRAPLLRA